MCMTMWAHGLAECCAVGPTPCWLGPASETTRVSRTHGGVNMHNLPIGRGWSANHNGDFSGDVDFSDHDGKHYVIPFFALEAVVAEKVRRERIAALEDADPGDLLK